MRRVHSGRHANEDAVFVIASTVQSARPDWLWSGTGFRLDDRVYREDRVTHPLKLQQDSPPHTLTGTDSALHYAILCVLFLPLSLLSPPPSCPHHPFLFFFSLSLCIHLRLYADRRSLIEILRPLSCFSLDPE